MTRLRHTNRVPARPADLVLHAVRDTPTAAARALGNCVYAVRTPDGLIKIGYTSNIGQRIRGFGSVWADVLLVLSADMDYERAVLARFKPYVARGREYHYPVAEIVDWINDERACMKISPIAA